VIDWPQIFDGAALSTLFAAAVLVLLRRERTPLVLVPALAAAFLGPLAWNAILHRATTDADGFFVDIPVKPFPVSWQDTGSGVFTLAAASLLLGLTLRQDAAGRSSASGPPSPPWPSWSTSTCAKRSRTS
jgi:hypothetical protein